MGEILQANQGVTMETLKNEASPTKLQVHKLREKNGEVPLLDPVTHCKLMRLFSRNAGVNLCLPVLKLHRLETQDLKHCKGLSEECMHTLTLELRRIVRNKRRRLNRRIKKFPKNFVSTKGSCSKKLQKATEFLFNGSGTKLPEFDGVVPGPSKGGAGDIIVKKEPGDEESETVLGKNSEQKQLKKKAKSKEGHKTSGPSLASPKCRESPVRKASWEELYIPSLSGPRAPLPPAPLLNLNLPIPPLHPKPVGLPKQSQPFKADARAASLPTLKPFHSSGAANLYLNDGLLNFSSSSQSNPSSSSDFMKVSHFPSTSCESLANQANRIPQDGVLPAAPKLSLKSGGPAKFINKTPLFGPTSLKSQPSKVISRPPPLVPIHRQFPLSHGISLPHGSTSLSQSRPVFSSPSMSCSTGFANEQNVPDCQPDVSCSTWNVELTPASKSEKSGISDDICKVKKEPEVEAGTVNVKSLWYPPICNSVSSVSTSSTSVMTSTSLSTQDASFPKTDTSQPYPVSATPSMSFNSASQDDNNSNFSLVLVPYTQSSKNVSSTEAVTDTNVSQLYLLLAPTASMSANSSTLCQNASVSGTKDGLGTFSNATKKIVDTQAKKKNASQSSPVKTYKQKLPKAIAGSPSKAEKSTSFQESSPAAASETSEGKSTNLQTPFIEKALSDTSMCSPPATTKKAVKKKAKSDRAVSSVGIKSKHTMNDKGDSDASRISSPLSSQMSVASKNISHGNNTIPNEKLDLGTSVVAGTNESYNDKSNKESHWSQNPLPSSLVVPNTTPTDTSDTSSVKWDPKSLVGFENDAEVEESLMKFLEKNYEVCEGKDIEQFKIQRHFVMYLHEIGRKLRYKAHPPILECLKKIFGDIITTRRHRTAERQQRWHYCHIQLREGVVLPYMAPPKSKVRKRRKALQAEGSSKIYLDNQKCITKSVKTPENVISVSGSLAVLLHLIKTTKLSKNESIKKEGNTAMYDSSSVSAVPSTSLGGHDSSVNTDKTLAEESALTPVSSNTTLAEESALSNTTLDEEIVLSNTTLAEESAFSNVSSNSTLTIASSGSTLTTVNSSPNVTTVCSISMETTMSSSINLLSEKPDPTKASLGSGSTIATENIKHNEASVSLDIAVATTSSDLNVASETSDRPIAEQVSAPCNLQPTPSCTSTSTLAFSVLPRKMESLPDLPLLELPLKNVGHLVEWIESKLASGKKVRSAMPVMKLKRLRHCKVTNLFLKRNRISMESGMRVRQMLRTWDIRNFLQAGGKKHHPAPASRIGRIPKVGPFGSKSAAVQQMLMEARIGVSENMLTDIFPAPSASASLVSPRPASKSLLLKKMKDPRIVSPLPLDINPVLSFHRRDKRLVMRNERLTAGQTKFATWIGLNLAKRAAKNRRLDRLLEGRRLPDLRFFGFRKENVQQPSPASAVGVSERKPDATDVHSTLAGTATSSTGHNPQVPTNLYIPVHTNMATTFSFGLPHGHTAVEDSSRDCRQVLKKIRTRLAFLKTGAPVLLSSSITMPKTAPLQEANTPPGTVICSTSQNASVTSLSTLNSTPVESDDASALRPGNRASPPPRLTFMGSSGVHGPGIRENPVDLRIQRPMPPPLSFMGPAVDSQGKHLTQHGSAQGTVVPWSGSGPQQASALRNFAAYQRHFFPSQHSANLSCDVTSHMMTSQEVRNPSQVSKGNGVHLSNQALNRNQHLEERRPSSLPHSVQGLVPMDQRPSSEPQCVESSASDRSSSDVAQNTQAPTTEVQPQNSTLPVTSEQMTSNAKSVLGYNFPHGGGGNESSGHQTVQGLGLPNQHVFSQPQHQHDQQFPLHQQCFRHQQPNPPHPFHGQQPLSSQSYVINYVYPNQHHHGFQAHGMGNQQYQRPRHNSQPYFGSLQSFNQPHSSQGYPPNQMYMMQNQNVKQQQLAGSSYSIQNLISPKQQHYLGPGVSQENVLPQHSSCGSQSQTIANDRVVGAKAPVQVQAASSQEIWNKHQGEQFMVRYQTDQKNTFHYVPTVTAQLGGNYSQSHQQNDVLNAGVPNTVTCTKEETMHSHTSKSNEQKRFSVIVPSGHNLAVSQNATLLEEGKGVSRQVGLDSSSKDGPSSTNFLDVGCMSSLSFSATDITSNGNQKAESAIVLPSSHINRLQSIQRDSPLPNLTVNMSDFDPNHPGTTKQHSIVPSQSEKQSFICKESDSMKISERTATPANEKSQSPVTAMEHVQSELDAFADSGSYNRETLSFTSLLQESHGNDDQKSAQPQSKVSNKLVKEDILQLQGSSERAVQPSVLEVSHGSDISHLSLGSEAGTVSSPFTNSTKGNLQLTEHLTRLETVLTRLIEIGLPTTSESIIQTVKQLLEAEGVCSSYYEDVEIHKWYQGFSVLQPHHVQEKKAKQHSSASEVNDVALWINKTKGDLMPFINKNASRIFYMQELNFLLDRKTRHIKYHKMFSENKCCLSEKDTVSVLFTFSANGQIGPGMIIFPRMVIPERLFASLKNTDCGKDWVIGSSANGFLYSDCISEFISDVFIPWIESSNLEQPVGIFTSEYISNISLSSMCQNILHQGVHLILVPRVMSPVVSPADKIVVQQFCSQWGKIVRDWSLTNDLQPLKEDNFAPFILSFIKKNIRDSELTKAFCELGLWPFDGRLIFELFQKSKL